ncbi:MAG: hybrid sensor histidine kinase/response regulator [Myxococcaceae bacterium]|nr:hybrid sensor histidine kinase/response regulator [Myxococcaceae bacterium]
MAGESRSGAAGGASDTGVAGSRPALMVIDDDGLALEAITAMLRGHGYDVDPCASATEALARLSEGAAPRVIVLDLLMPEMDGWEFRARQLREPAWAHIPVVAISADTSAKARAIHADAFLPKPLDGALLLQTIDRLLQFPAGKRLQSYLMRGERPELTAPLAGIAHELNNSLAYVLGTLELAETKARELETRLRGPEAFTMVGLRQLVARAQRGADRIASVIRDIERPRRPGSDDRKAFDSPRARDSASIWNAPLYRNERDPHPAEPAFLRNAQSFLRGESFERNPPQRASVLVVDDEAMICELVADILEEDYDVITFTDPRAALASMLAGSFDVIVCDLLMPELTGMDLYEQLATQRPDLTQRIVFLSGGGFTDDARDFLARVRRPQVKKPFLHSELVDAIEEQLTPKH